MRTVTRALLLGALAFGLAGCQTPTQQESAQIAAKPNPPALNTPGQIPDSGADTAEALRETAPASTDSKPDTGSASAAASASETPQKVPGTTNRYKLPSGLEYEEIKVGNGPAAKAGDTVLVHYTGVLENGTKFDSSVDRGQPFDFSLGMGQVIKGWDLGVAGMKPGGKRKLFIPSELGYGANGTPDGTIPPNSKLIFDVELLKINP